MCHEVRDILHMLRWHHYRRFEVSLYISNILLSSCYWRKNLLSFCVFQAFHFEVFSVYLPTTLQTKFQKLFRMPGTMDHTHQLHQTKILFVQLLKIEYFDNQLQKLSRHGRKSSYPT
jgi:hypothetical protein